MVVQPELPDHMDWPEITLSWWRALGTLPGADEFTDAQWLYLMDTALLHAAVWTGDFSRHGELGKRLEAFGVTPVAMARLNKAAPRSKAGKKTTGGKATAGKSAPLTPLEAARARRRSREAAS